MKDNIYQDLWDTTFLKLGAYIQDMSEEVEVVKDRWSDGIALEISHNGWQITAINDLDLEDLKKLRKVI